jgi:hypothetical protein
MTSYTQYWEDKKGNRFYPEFVAGVSNTDLRRTILMGKFGYTEKSHTHRAHQLQLESGEIQFVSVKTGKPIKKTAKASISGTLPKSKTPDKKRDAETFKKTGLYYLTSNLDALKNYFLPHAHLFSLIDIDSKSKMPYGILKNNKRVKTVKKGDIFVLREINQKGARSKTKLNGTNTYAGKDEQINGKWYPVTVQADSLTEAIQSLRIGQRKSYGRVEAIRGRFYLVD